MVEVSERETIVAEREAIVPEREAIVQAVADERPSRPMAHGEVAGRCRTRHSGMAHADAAADTSVTHCATGVTNSATATHATGVTHAATAAHSATAVAHAGRPCRGH